MLRRKAEAGGRDQGGRSAGKEVERHLRRHEEAQFQSDADRARQSEADGIEAHREQIHSQGEQIILNCIKYAEAVDAGDRWALPTPPPPPHTHTFESGDYHPPFLEILIKNSTNISKCHDFWRKVCKRFLMTQKNQF